MYLANIILYYNNCLLLWISFMDVDLMVIIYHTGVVWRNMRHKVLSLIIDCGSCLDIDSIESSFTVNTMFLKFPGLCTINILYTI